MATSRQVIDDLVRGRRAERVGLSGGPWTDTMVAWVEQGYPLQRVYRDAGELRWRREDGRWAKAEIAGEYEEPVPPWQHFGYDMGGLELRPLTGADFVLEVFPQLGRDDLVEETAQWDVRRNGAGAAVKYWKHKMGTPEHIGYDMVTREVWERDYRPHLVDLDPRRVKLERLRESLSACREHGLFANVTHMFVWELMRQSMGDLTLYQSLLLDPGWVHDFCRVYTGFFRKHWSYILEHVGRPDAVWLCEDLGYKNGLFASPKVLAALVFPYYRELVTFFHGYDVPVILHTCGSVAEALPMIVEAGFDALNPIERKALNNDPFAFAEKYGDRLAFVGGLDARVLESNDKELIQREVSAYIEGMKARGARLVFAEDHSISPNVGYVTYLYALQVYRDHMWT